MRTLLVRSVPAFAVASLAVACGSASTQTAATLGDRETGASARQEPTPPVRAEAEPGDAPCPVDPVYFAFDSSDLDATSRDKLGRTSRCLASRGAGAVLVTGMTDPRGTEEYNLALGERRARTVAGYIQSLGVAGDVQAHSVGEEMASGADESGWARDRRAEMQAR